MVIPLKTHAVRLSNSASSHCDQNKCRHVQTYARSQTSSKADVEFEVGFQERAHGCNKSLIKTTCKTSFDKEKKEGGTNNGEKVCYHHG